MAQVMLTILALFTLSGLIGFVILTAAIIIAILDDSKDREQK